MKADRHGFEGSDLAGAAPARPENTAAGQKALREKLTAKAAALVPLLRAKAAEIELDGRIPDEVLAAIDAAQLFRLRTPQRFGGFEADIRTYMDVVTELGRGCGSTSWVAFISIATVWIAALFPDEAQNEVFADNPDVRFMGALGMTARARAAAGGYRLDGKWAYASNCLHAHWAVLSAPLPRGDAVVPSILLVPMRDLAIEESWHVVGMRGTGSHTVIAKDIFVPAHRALPTEILAQGRSPRTNRDEFVYRESFAPTAIIAVAAPVLGMAQAALDLTLERINKSPKAIAYSFYDDLRKAPSMQHELAEAATLIETAVLHGRRWAMILLKRRAPAKNFPSPSARRCAWISATPWRAAAKRSGSCSMCRALPLSPSPIRSSGSGAIWKWPAVTGCWPAKFRRKSTDAR